jgi:hypothetical protein
VTPVYCKQGRNEIQEKNSGSSGKSFVEFPEFLDVIFSNSLKPFIKLAVRMLGGSFFWRRRRFLSKISSMRLKALSIKEMEEP